MTARDQSAAFLHRNATYPDRLDRLAEDVRRLQAHGTGCPVTLGRNSLEGYEMRCHGPRDHAGDVHVGLCAGAWVWWEHHIVRPRMVDTVPEGMHR